MLRFINVELIFITIQLKYNKIHELLLFHVKATFEINNLST